MAKAMKNAMKAAPKKAAPMKAKAVKKTPKAATPKKNNKVASKKVNTPKASSPKKGITPKNSASGSASTKAATPRPAAPTSNHVGTGKVPFRKGGDVRLIFRDFDNNRRNKLETLKDFRWNNTVVTLCLTKINDQQ